MDIEPLLLHVYHAGCVCPGDDFWRLSLAARDEATAMLQVRDIRHHRLPSHRVASHATASIPAFVAATSTLVLWQGCIDNHLLGHSRVDLLLVARLGAETEATQH